MNGSGKNMLSWNRSARDVNAEAALDIECPGPDLPQRLRAGPADQLPGDGVLVRAPGVSVPSPVLFRQMGDRFRRAVVSFSDANHIPWIKFGKDEPTSCR